MKVDKMPQKEVFKLTFGREQEGMTETVFVKFVDREFLRVDFSFCGPYTREQWTMLAKVEEFIAAKEKEWASA